MSHGGGWGPGGGWVVILLYSITLWPRVIEDTNECSYYSLAVTRNCCQCKYTWWRLTIIIGRVFDAAAVIIIDANEAPAAVRVRRWVVMLWKLKSQFSSALGLSSSLSWKMKRTLVYSCTAARTLHGPTVSVQRRWTRGSASKVHQTCTIKN